MDLRSRGCFPAWTKKKPQGPKGPAAGRGVFSFTDLRLKLHGPATEGQSLSSAHPPCLVSASRHRNGHRHVTSLELVLAAQKKTILVREYFFSYEKNYSRTKKQTLVPVVYAPRTAPVCRSPACVKKLFTSTRYLQCAQERRCVCCWSKHSQPQGLEGSPPKPAKQRIPAAHTAFCTHRTTREEKSGV